MQGKGRGRGKESWGGVLCACLCVLFVTVEVGGRAAELHAEVKFASGALTREANANGEPVREEESEGGRQCYFHRVLEGGRG